MKIGLLGDSIFDNSSYVPHGMSVAEIFQAFAPDDDVRLLARDGATVEDVIGQCLMGSADKFIVSVGGNDALRHAYKVSSGKATVDDLAEMQDDFRADYADMLDMFRDRWQDLAVCTIYNVYELSGRELMGLSLFNDVIITEADKRGITVHDIRTVVVAKRDFTNRIEPSAYGSMKLARFLANIYAPDAEPLKGWYPTFVGTGQNWWAAKDKADATEGNYWDNWKPAATFPASEADIIDAEPVPINRYRKNWDNVDWDDDETGWRQVPSETLGARYAEPESLSEVVEHRARNDAEAGHWWNGDEFLDNGESIQELKRGNRDKQRRMSKRERKKARKAKLARAAEPATIPLDGAYWDAASEQWREIP